MTYRQLYGITLLATFLSGAYALTVGILLFPGGYGAAAVFFGAFLFALIKYRSLWKDIPLDDPIYFIIDDTDEIRLVGCSRCNVGEWLDAVCSENGTRLVKSYSEFMEAPGSVMILKGTVLDYDPRSG